jgi:L-rhamnose mutarotase
MLYPYKACGDAIWKKTKEFLRKCYLAKYTLDEFLRNAPYKMFYLVICSAWCEILNFRSITKTRKTKKYDKIQFSYMKKNIQAITAIE